MPPFAPVFPLHQAGVVLGDAQAPPPSPPAAATAATAVEGASPGAPSGTAAEPQTDEEYSPFLTTALLPRTAPPVRMRVPASDAAHPELYDTSVLDVHPYSAVELVRVHRLQGRTKYNRGIYAGLPRRSYTTRSGQLRVGHDGDGAARVRPGVYGLLWAARQSSGSAPTLPESDSATGDTPHSPRRFVLCPIVKGNRISFQWSEADLPPSGRTADYAYDDGGWDDARYGKADSPLGFMVKGLMDNRCGSELTLEQRAEAARRLQARRAEQRGSSATHHSSPDSPNLRGRRSGAGAGGDGGHGASGGVHRVGSSAGGTRQSLSATGDEGALLRLPQDGFGSGAYGAAHDADLSPVVIEVDDLSHMSANASLTQADWSTTSPPRGSTVGGLSLAKPCEHSGAGGEERRPRRGEGDPLSTTHHPGMSLSSLGHTMKVDEAETHHPRRLSRLGQAAANGAGSRADGSHGPPTSTGASTSASARRKVTSGPAYRQSSTADGRSSGASRTYSGTNASINSSTTSAPASPEARRRLSNTACLDPSAAGGDEGAGASAEAEALAEAAAAAAAEEAEAEAEAERDGAPLSGSGSKGRRPRAGATPADMWSSAGLLLKSTSSAGTAGTDDAPAGAKAGQSPSPSITSPDDGLMFRLKDDVEHQLLDEFLTIFPEEEDHVRLRRTAKNILDGLEDIWGEDDDTPGGRSSFPLPHFLNSGFQFPNADDAVAAAAAGGERSASDGGESLMGFGVDDAELREKFRREAEEDCAELVAQRNALLVELEEQRQLLRDFVSDAHFLSVGQARTTITAEQYAIELTSNVNKYAKSHQLRLNRAMSSVSPPPREDGEGEKSTGPEAEEAPGKDAEQPSQESPKSPATEDEIDHVGEGFLDRFGRERAPTADVGCQVCDADLSYVDAAVRSTEEQLEDLFLHEKALVNAVRLATVAVANILTFHASLEMESTCHECFFVFDKPRTLWPCGHTFCLSCLSNMYNRRGELVCSECGSVCEVGYTPNISVELIANYQTVYKRDDPDSSLDIDSAAAEEREAQTIEGVLRSLLGDLLATQSNWAAIAVDHTPNKGTAIVS